MGAQQDSNLRPPAFKGDTVSKRHTTQEAETFCGNRRGRLTAVVSRFQDSSLLNGWRVELVRKSAASQKRKGASAGNESSPVASEREVMMKGFVQDIEDLAVKNDEFRRVLYRAKHCQLRGHGVKAQGRNRGGSPQTRPVLSRVTANW
jgi:hypothetical protein